mmetsp:Transcript_17294/g.20363  ORF Transcript_17294/g.20363 Transcript_17294/m.20363 type:complete len:242 (+) Transcript_17294:56-781(+)|eukprot:CAMPEP_0114328938 /NCGR_PEP_ID=MMETSP0101-20121206/739_1 /TAXON_ID=38822 ORGANISM="Pteridomonas danica, Strain PT" /NCGR_SAMPLE_ID=MMETSP0101 /ASSEMBLY_ACC=CAM_ASM_000211 /LENGTH=241 /DNA_ID=CAMNT_0001458425 /DNA_START=1 /DNA_END=726 /DNA_ORIENTATION=-
MVLEGVLPVTPPALVRIGMFAAYVYTWSLGLKCLANPWSSHEKLIDPVASAQVSVFVLSLVYAVDALLAASPLRWCCMRSIPPKNVVTHHVPFVIGMLPSVMLALFFKKDFTIALLATPFSMTYMAAGCLTSSNEALWVASSFFTPNMLNSKIYRVGQKLFALCALTQFILIGGVSAFMAASSLVPYIMAGELVFVRMCMVVPCMAFFIIVPVVQVPLLKGAWARFLDALKSDPIPTPKKE